MLQPSLHLLLINTQIQSIVDKAQQPLWLLQPEMYDTVFVKNAISSQISH
ncbi:hypothetical protein [Candidatus Coxiella mudrowiae]|nr:hypothetical protein [Candidatus Coxiella mudrowiae]